MPAKKTKKKTVKSKKSARTTAKKTAARKRTPPRKTTRRKPSKKRASKRVKAKAPKRSQDRGPIENTLVPPRPSGRSGRQSGDLQGLTRRKTADSESVEELLEEGNTFEAGVVTGVEEAENDAPREVHTHEVPVDDVPEEYLDKD